MYAWRGSASTFLLNWHLSSFPVTVSFLSPTHRQISIAQSDPHCLPAWILAYATKNSVHHKRLTQLCEILLSFWNMHTLSSSFLSSAGPFSSFSGGFFTEISELSVLNIRESFLFKCMHIYLCLPICTHKGFHVFVSIAIIKRGIFVEWPLYFSVLGKRTF